METIYTCNHLESLCEKLASKIRESEHDVFAKEVIITQTAGMNAWLKTELAQRNGVFANIEFKNQDGFLSGIYQLLFNERLQNNFDDIKYKIYNSLDSNVFKESFTEVAQYYENNELRRAQLASKIADLFDQYQLYRPEMIEKWENRELTTQNATQEWQQWLWQQLNTESRQKIKNRIVAELEQKQDLIRKTYPVISLFGITIYTEYHLNFFRELAKYTEVNFYVCLPADQLPFKNELLLSFGSKAAELAGMFEIAEFKKELNDADTLLSRIQNQILNDTNDFEWKDDDSIQINACYTPVREAECLYNYLLNLFENNNELRPRDVLVMTTDINKYAPYIKAVFRNAPVNIPFQVSGAANNSDDSMAAVLEQIMNFTEEDLTSEKVISLLEQKRIKKRFGIQDVSYIRSVVRKANIRFGRENSLDDDTHYVSWKYGLDKILLGYAMLTDQEYPVDEHLTLYPFKDSESSSSYDLLRLKAFVETLLSVIDAQKESRSLPDWKTFLFEVVINNMIFWDDFNKEDRAELSAIYKALSFIDKLDFTNTVCFSVFLDELKTKVFTESRESKLNTGRVTVSSPIPVRGLPYKVICFLGLNNDVFPRKNRLMGFDLLGEDYLAGDRNIKETDKYLFLDTMLAAREKLYLSYIGQSVKDNTEIPPSIVIDTLLDYIGQENFVVKHPLHGYSARYQQNDKRLFTYLYNQNADEYPIKEKREDGAVSEVSVKNLVKFFQAPIDWYFNTILDIRFDDNDSRLSETELFDLDNLQKWKIKNDLLRLEDNDFESYLNRGKKEGFLPFKSTAEVMCEDLMQEIKYIKPVYKNLTANRTEDKIVIDTVIDNTRITGTIECVYDRKFITYCLSNNLAKYKIEAYIKSLLLIEAGKIDSAVFLDINGVVTEVPFPEVTAKCELEALLQYYKEGNSNPLLFTIEAAESFAKTSKNKTKTEQILDAFNNEAFPNQYRLKPPNLYLQILIRENYFENFGEDDLQKIDDLSQKLKINLF